MTDVSIGRRIRFQNKRGTIRYIGPVISDTNKSGPKNGNQPRIWLGVEWDNDGDGIHDGSCVDDSTGEVHRYFSCPPRRGSFVKPEKVCTPLTFAQAYALRYSEIEKPVEGVMAPSISGKDLRIAGLADSNVGTPDWDDSQDFDFIESMDLSGTLFASWIDLLRTAERLTNLQELVAANNPGLDCEIEDAKVNLPYLRVLALTGCGQASVKAVLSLIDNIPQLHTLHLSYCDLVSIPEAIPLSVEELDLSFNLLHHLDEREIRKLAALPNLSVLIMNGNKDLIWNEPCATNPLLRLQKLCIDGTALIQTWKQLEFLATVCPNLKDLRMWNIPLVQGELATLSDVSSDAALTFATGIRAKIMVRFPLLMRLNGTEVTSRIRVESELFCLKSGDEFPHRARIAAAHGLSDFASVNQTRPTSTGFMQVTFESGKAENKSVTRRLPVGTKLNNIITIHSRLFVAHLGSENLQLEYEELGNADTRQVVALENTDKLSLLDVIPSDPNMLRHIWIRPAE